jgi:hypothetical protein
VDPQEGCPGGQQQDYQVPEGPPRLQEVDRQEIDQEQEENQIPEVDCGCDEAQGLEEKDLGVDQERELQEVGQNDCA